MKASRSCAFTALTKARTVGSLSLAGAIVMPASLTPAVPARHRTRATEWPRLFLPSPDLPSPDLPGPPLPATRTAARAAPRRVIGATVVTREGKPSDRHRQFRESP
ncbi:hypothetical protein GCM10027075_33200 [Streptomyces heilongjiangensis]